MDDRLVDGTVIAELLGVPATWVAEHARAGTIPHYRLGRYVRYRIRRSWPGLTTAGPAADRRHGRGPDTEGVIFDATQGYSPPGRRR